MVVQLQGGLSPAEAFAGADRRFRLEPVPDEAWDNGAPKRLQRTRAWVRVDSDGREPVWAVVPVTLHRPIPDDARIKWVYLIRRRVASKDNWSLCLVLSRQSGWMKTDLARGGCVGIDIGWRLVPDGLRVAYWVGDDGRSGQLVLPLRDVGRWQKAQDLQSIRSKNFDAVVLRLANWLRGRDLPDWLIERTKTLRQWRSQARLASVAIHWRGNRFDGDGEIFDAIEAWRKQDKHLWEWEHNQRRKAAAWREDTYRQLAAKLSRAYRTVCLEKTDWRQLARQAKPEEEGNAQAAHYMRTASPGQLTRLLAERFAEVVRVDPAHTTQRCHACGKLTPFDAAAQLTTTCRHCGAEWDQDFNAACNLLGGAARGPVMQKTP